MPNYENQMLQVIHYLSENIGGRGSCTANERRAADFTAEQLRMHKANPVFIEPFQAIPSTYWPYSLALGLAFAGSLSYLFFGGRGPLIIAILFNFLGFIGMAAEIELISSWMRWFLPKAQSQNVLAIIPAQESVRTKVVFCAHLDTHRTPIFYSTQAWQKAFSILTGAAILSMFIGSIACGAGLILAGAGCASCAWPSA